MKSYSSEEEYKLENIEKDFDAVLPLLKRSIYYLENAEKEGDNNRKNMLTALLDPNINLSKDAAKFDPNANMLL